MPLAKMGVAVYQLQAFDPNSPVGQFQAALQDPQIRELVDVVTPWINLAVDAIIEAQSEGNVAQADAIKSQVATVLEVLKVLRTITGESYLEDNVMVTHTLMEIRDVEP